MQFESKFSLKLLRDFLPNNFNMIAAGTLNTPHKIKARPAADGHSIRGKWRGKIQSEKSEQYFAAKR